MPAPLTADEAVEVLVYLGATLRRNENGLVIGVLRLDSTRCICPQVDLNQPEFGGRTADRFRRSLGLDFDEFARLRAREMTPNEYRDIMCHRLASD